jgi:oligopeptide transport system ATP-binding protein
MPPLLEVKNLRISFQTFAGEVQAVRNVSFHVDEGEALAIVGESGCGKSVTAQAIMRLNPHPPGKVLGGEIIYQGDDILKKSKREMERIRGNEIGMIFQDPMTSLNPTMRVGKQIMEVLRRHRNSSRTEAQQQALELLDMVKIPQAKKRFLQHPFELSGGMRQRVMIAIALACRPRLLIADEPTTALDVTIQAEILDLMKELKDEMQMSIILITHDLGVVASMCDRVMVMYAGEVAETCSVDDTFYSTQHPYTQALLHAVPCLNRDKNQALHSIIGTPPGLLNPPKGCAFAPRCDFAMELCADNKPAFYKVSNEHYARCWLHHEHAKERKQEFLDRSLERRGAHG